MGQGVSFGSLTRKNTRGSFFTGGTVSTGRRVGPTSLSKAPILSFSGALFSVSSVFAWSPTSPTVLVVALTLLQHASGDIFRVGAAGLARPDEDKAGGLCCRSVMDEGGNCAGGAHGVAEGAIGALTDAKSSSVRSSQGSLLAAVLAEGRPPRHSSATISSCRLTYQ